MSELVFPAGSAIAFSEGEYSDFGYCGIVVTLKECNLPALATEFREGFKPEDDWDGPDPKKFVAWLVSHGHVFPANWQEVHLGGYGCLEVGS